jgi:hypothetical protein
MTSFHPYPANATISNTEISDVMLDTLKQLTVEEKVTLLTGRDFSSLAAVPRLNIPPIKVNNKTTSKIPGTSCSNSSLARR